MPSTVWKGALSFGLVNIPVGLYSATSDRTIRFHQFQRGTADRVRNKRVNERTGEEVSYSEIVKGYDLGGGGYVLLEPEELEAAAPERSRSIEILSFVDQPDIDPIYYRSTYYLAPDGEAAARAYALLRQAMTHAGKVAVATLVMRNKEYLVTVRPTEEVLALETMYFADEVRDPSAELGDLLREAASSGKSGQARPSAKSGFSDKELATANLLLESMARPWDPDEYRDTYRERVEEMVARKQQGEDVVSQAPEPELSPVVDLMEALQASIRRTKTADDGAGDDGAGDTAAASTTQAAKRRAPARPAKRPTAKTRRPAKAPSAAKASGSASSKASGKKASPRKKATARQAPARPAAARKAS